MTKTERTDLCRLIRRREKVSKTAATQRAAELKADVEQKLSAIYSSDDDETFSKLYQEAKKAAQEADAGIKSRCEELGMPASFAPGISLGWYDRGENVVKERRAELRLAAYARIDALEKKACTIIEVEGVELESKVLADGLTSEAAQDFLAKMPAVKDLMPALDANEIKLLADS